MPGYRMTIGVHPILVACGPAKLRAFLEMSG
jgi:hypothetical protein